MIILFEKDLSGYHNTLNRKISSCCLEARSAGVGNNITWAFGGTTSQRQNGRGSSKSHLILHFAMLL